MVDRVKSRRDEILSVARRHGVTRVRVFGSMARGDAGPASDLDLLVDVGPDTSPWFPGGSWRSWSPCWAGRYRS